MEKYKFPLKWAEKNCMSCGKIRTDRTWVPDGAFIFIPCDQVPVCPKYLRDFRTHLYDRLMAGEEQGPVPTLEEPCKWSGLCALMGDSCTDTALWGSDLCLYDKDGFEIIEED